MYVLTKTFALMDLGVVSYGIIIIDIIKIEIINSNMKSPRKCVVKPMAATGQYRSLYLYNSLIRVFSLFYLFST